VTLLMTHMMQSNPNKGLRNGTGQDTRYRFMPSKRFTPGVETLYMIPNPSPYLPTIT
jgi:hypothetical protein